MRCLPQLTGIGKEKGNIICSIIIGVDVCHRHNFKNIRIRGNGMTIPVCDCHADIFKTVYGPGRGILRIVVFVVRIVFSCNSFSGEPQLGCHIFRRNIWTAIDRTAPLLVLCHQFLENFSGQALGWIFCISSLWKKMSQIQLCDIRLPDFLHSFRGWLFRNCFGDWRKDNGILFHCFYGNISWLYLEKSGSCNRPYADKEHKNSWNPLAAVFSQDVAASFYQVIHEKITSFVYICSISISI